MMKTLKPQTIQAAPDGSKEGLRSIQKRFGFIPNLMATLANSPAVLNGYLALDAAWENSSLTREERQIVLLTASVENKCRYCVAAHVTGLKAMRLDAGAIAHDCEDGIGAGREGLHRHHEIVAILDVSAVDGFDPVTNLQARTFGRRARLHLVDQRS